MTYFVTEIQNATMTVYAYDDFADAQSKYHTILSYAAKSDVEKHGAMIINGDAIVLEQRMYKHPAQD